ncbi:MAG: hypothetical protein CBC74_001635 [Crocinitomicaceae bacterium TMED114]|nr:MAG: hypothetical protein CBC74_001635 [Crocinitomicaceae bacterium TMED114]
MRKLFFLAIVALSTQMLTAQCNELFISEYIEGWSNNKALEIYNPTGNAIDMTDYRLERYANGATAAQDNQKTDLTGTIEPGGVLVYVIDKQDPDGVDFEAPVWDELAEQADIWLNPDYQENNTMYFNGNDAMVLRKISTNSPVDIFGVIGEDPGSAGWDEITQNHTLVRRPEVTGGDTQAVDEFDVLAVWDSLEVNTFDQLGFHVCDCVTSVEETRTSQVKAFPNPFHDRLDLLAAQPIAGVVVRTLAGAEVLRPVTNGRRQLRLDLADLPTGAYLVEVRLTDGSVTRHQAVKH